MVFKQWQNYRTDVTVIENDNLELQLANTQKDFELEKRLQPFTRSKSAESLSVCLGLRDRLTLRSIQSSISFSIQPTARGPSLIERGNCFVDIC